MNRLEEIQEIIKKFIYEKQQMNQKIAEIEKQRTILAEERNKKINESKNTAYTENVQEEIIKLGNQIRELGNQSQELQNKLDKNYLEIKDKVKTEVNRDIATIMSEIRKIEGQKEELEQSNIETENRQARYEKQKQEFFNKFGRIPVLSENVQKENEIQEKTYQKNKATIEKLNKEIAIQEEQITELVKTAKEFKEGKIYGIKNIEEQNQQNEENEKTVMSTIETEETNVIVKEPIIEKIIEDAIELIREDIVAEEETITLPYLEKIEPIEEIEVEEIEPIEEIEVEEIKVEEIEPIEEIRVEEIEPIEEIQVEEIAPIGETKKVEETEPIEEIRIEEIVPIEELKLEEVEPIQEIKVEETEPSKETKVEKIEAIEEITQEEEEIELEEIIAAEEAKIEEQLNNITNTEKIEENVATEKEQNEETIISYEEDIQKSDNYIGEKVTLSNIIAKFDNNEIVYKAQISNGDCIKIYPRKAKTGNILLKDKENREELKEILINYAIAEYRVFDKKVIKKVDPSICEILIRFAKKYNYDAQNLIYNYAMSFSKNEEAEVENTPTITYNFSYIEESNLDKKEKEVIAKICKNARKNNRIDIIGYNAGIRKIRYILKRTFSVNNANALPEGKC